MKASSPHTKEVIIGDFNLDRPNPDLSFQFVCLLVHLGFFLPS